jgi:hypothetical protein
MVIEAFYRAETRHVELAQVPSSRRLAAHSSGISPPRAAQRLWWHRRNMMESTRYTCGASTNRIRARTVTKSRCGVLKAPVSLTCDLLDSAAFADHSANRSCNSSGSQVTSQSVRMRIIISTIIPKVVPFSHNLDISVIFYDILQIWNHTCGSI